MKLGGYEVKVAVDAMPQKVATAFGEVFESMLGAKYTPVAYLGSQVVNGTNHAILAEQTVITGTDHKNVVLITMNEKPQGVTLVGIEPILESGAPMGGTVVDVKTAIPAEAKKAFDDAFGSFVGSSVKPFAYLGSQVVNGTNYYFAAEVAPLVAGSNRHASVKLVTVNTNGGISFDDIIG